MIKVFYGVFLFFIFFLVFSSSVYSSDKDIGQKYIITFEDEGLVQEVIDDVGTKDGEITVNLDEITLDSNIVEDYFEEHGGKVEILKSELGIGGDDLNLFSSNDKKNIQKRYNIVEYKNLFSGISININDKEELEQIMNLPFVKGVELETIYELLVDNVTHDLMDTYNIHNGSSFGTNYTGKGIKIAVLDSGVDIRHEDFGSCLDFTNWTINTGSSVSFSLESNHSYNSNVNTSFIINLSNTSATNFSIIFANLSVEEGFDVLTLYDINGTFLENFSLEDRINHTSSIIQGSFATLVLTTDSSVTDFGFKIDTVVVNVTGSQVNYCNKVSDAYDFVGTDTIPLDVDYHGTHVASIASSNNSNDELRGIAPESQIAVYRVCQAVSCSSSAILSALDRSVDPNSDGNYSDSADIVSMSLGGTGTPGDSLSLRTDTVASLGILPSVANGNSGNSFSTSQSPGVARSAISVGATFKANETYSSQNGVVDDVVDFSSRGPSTTGTIEPDIVAPGVKICAAASSVSSLSPGDCGGSSNHFRISGTSMATPLISGVLALLNEKNPTWTNKQLRASIKSTAKDIGLGYFIQGWGRVDPVAALSLPNSSCITEINSSGISSIVSLGSVDNLTFEFYVSCNQFRNYTIELSKMYDFSNKPDLWEEVANGSQNGTVSLNLNMTDVRGPVLIKVNGNDNNSNLSSFDLLYVTSNDDRLNFSEAYTITPTTNASNLVGSNDSYAGEVTNFTFNITNTRYINTSFNITLYSFIENSTILLNSSNSFDNGVLNFSLNEIKSKYFNFSYIENGQLFSNNYFYDNRLININGSWYVHVLDVGSSSVSMKLLFLDNRKEETIDSLSSGVNTLTRNLTLGQYEEVQIYIGVSKEDRFDGNNSLGYNLRSVTNVTLQNKTSTLVPPAITITSPLNNTEVNASKLEITFNATSNKSLNSFYYTNNNVLYNVSLGNGFSSINEDLIVNSYGVNNFTFFFTDTFGISVSIPISINITLNLGGNSTDFDGDGINDTLDTVLGESTNINTDFSNLSFRINSSTNLSTIFNETLNVTLGDGGINFVEFENNFSSNSINLTDIVLKKNISENNSRIFIKGLNLGAGETKTIFMNLSGNTSVHGSICIADTEVQNFENLTSNNCNGSFFTYVKSIPFSNDNYTVNYTSGSNVSVKITGLQNSGLFQMCTEDWSYSSFSTCSGGSQSRNATDANSCGTTFNQSFLTQSCTVTSEESSSSSSGGGGGGGGSSTSTTVGGFVPVGETERIIDEPHRVSSILESVDRFFDLKINGFDYEKDREFEGINKVIFTNKGSSLRVLEIEHNFSKDDLDVSDLEIIADKSDKNYVLIKGLEISDSKTVRLEKKDDHGSVCIRDAEVASIVDLSEFCQDANEYFIKCDGIVNGRYKCVDEGENYLISGLRHSLVVEFSEEETIVPVLSNEGDNSDVQEIEISSNSTINETLVESSSGGSTFFNLITYGALGVFVIILFVIIGPYFYNKKKHKNIKELDDRSSIVLNSKNYYEEYKDKYSKESIRVALEGRGVPDDIIDEVMGSD